MRVLNFIVAILTASITSPYQQWLDFRQAEDQVTRIWIQPRPDKSPGHFKFIYRTIQLPVTNGSNYHDFLGWIDCDTKDYLIEISGITSDGELFYAEKTDGVPFYGEPGQDTIDELMDLTCGN